MTFADLVVEAALLGASALHLTPLAGGGFAARAVCPIGPDGDAAEVVDCTIAGDRLVPVTPTLELAA